MRDFVFFSIGFATCFCTLFVGICAGIAVIQAGNQKKDEEETVK